MDRLTKQTLVFLVVFSGVTALVVHLGSYSISDLKSQIRIIRPWWVSDDGGATNNSAEKTSENFYDDPFTSYACQKHRHGQPGSLPDFLVTGVQKGE